MFSLKSSDFLVIGAGIIGICIARELKKHYPDCSVSVIEKESRIGMHASGRNSGVLHAGFYYTADSLKAKLCRDGNQALTAYCHEKKLRINQCGKLVVATNETELETLDELFKRGKQNQVQLEEISEEEAKEIEPKVFTLEKALYSSTTASVDPLEVLNSLYQDAQRTGVKFFFDRAYIEHDGDTVKTDKGLMRANYVINAAGLYADKIARGYGFSQDYTILPFKGLYLYAKENSFSLNTNIYPVPDLNNPFLGVHFTVTVGGRCKIGPTAIPAFWCENYKGLERFSTQELIKIVKLESKLLVDNPFNFRHLAISELQKYSRKKLTHLASKLVSKMNGDAFMERGKPGIRAQLVNIKNNTLEMDFKFEGDDKSFHILNAVSPAFTCSIPFSELMVKEIKQRIQ